MKDINALTANEIESVCGGIRLDDYTPNGDIRDLGNGGGRNPSPCADVIACWNFLFG